jgi:hypothetical protein
LIVLKVCSPVCSKTFVPVPSEFGLRYFSVVAAASCSHGRKLGRSGPVGYPRKIGDYRAWLNSHPSQCLVTQHVIQSTAVMIISFHYLRSRPCPPPYPRRMTGRSHMITQEMPSRGCPSYCHSFHSSLSYPLFGFPGSQASFCFHRIDLKVVACQPTPIVRRGSKESRYYTRPVGVTCMEILAATCVACQSDVALFICKPTTPFQIGCKPLFG